MNQSETNELISRFKQAGQGHVFNYFEELDESAQKRLLTHSASIDLEELQSLVEQHLNQAEDQIEQSSLEGLAPAPYVRLPGGGGNSSDWQAAFNAGAEAIAAGRVAAFTVAGGQGTRLGYDGPKGTFPVTTVSEKTLFQVFAEKLLRSGKRFGVTIPWFILTSETNNEATIAAFQKSDFWGLDPKSVHFIVQGLMPAVDFKGKILMINKSTIVMAPDGHGGSLRALVRSGAVEKMAAMGVDCISYFQVDNPLVRCIDPEFVGFHVLGQSELSSKMVPKAYAREKVGIFCLQEDTLKVVEYSDMPDAMQDELNEDGSIRYNAGNVAIHLFDREFIARVGGDDSDARLPFHRADKKIPFLNTEGQIVEPDSANGVKFEQFVFDALPVAKNPIVVETAREDEFSPVKNAEGKDSPKTCLEDQLRMFARWLVAAGETIETDASGLPKVTIEISHSFAADEADFIAQWPSFERKMPFSEGIIIE
ncbi:MAG: UDP-N-acetylglucosamine/UDP-N-acetylgalactosamine diphosphorylase [Lentimonas sp.]|jgi:UDP-N-acetylglucosamine/UDP-N-acetylgalactosamine diphosphorylase